MEKKKEDDSTTSSKKVKKEKKPVREADIIPEPEVPQEYVESGRTNYAKSRLRMNNTNPLWKDDEIDPLTLVKCQHFSGTPVTVALSQPFKVKVNSNVLLVSDFHSHLAYTEIIGFLAGDWNETEKLITIDEAFPCKSLASGSDNVNVEMDPTSELEVREIINKKGKRVCGWYHSHPVFQPDPSVRDIENQTNYQGLFRDQKNSVDPFVGLIVGPYDTRMPTEESTFNWFCVKCVPEGKGTPMYVEHEIINEETILQQTHLTIEKTC